MIPMQITSFVIKESKGGSGTFRRAGRADRLVLTKGLQPYHHDSLIFHSESLLILTFPVC